MPVTKNTTSDIHEDDKEKEHPGKVEVPTEPTIDAPLTIPPMADYKEAISAMVSGDLNKFNSIVIDAMKDKAANAVDSIEQETRNNMFNSSDSEFDVNNPEQETTSETESETETETELEAETEKENEDA